MEYRRDPFLIPGTIIPAPLHTFVMTKQTVRGTITRANTETPVSILNSNVAPFCLSLPLSPPGEKHPSSYRAPYSRIESANQSTTSSGESHFHIHSIAPRGTNWRGAIPRLFTDITISLSRITVDWFSVEAKSATVPRETGGWNGGAVGWEGSWKKRRKKDWKKKGERRKEGYKWERMEGDGGRGDISFLILY